MVNQAFQLASRFVSGDTNAAPKSPTAHTADRWALEPKRLKENFKMGHGHANAIVAFTRGVGKK
ncbi:MAG: hypothetical protein A2X25_07400 [Chloroflexi bacterium GWB2_49_20]|nr:MAG: hypothetical protein A2X25_07400 [Chloroflexi bacterium GWB2_49_20]OGN77981.1 MAG: hypothetical protein A2X26_15205 [Chloroflexi bacterium GWC2_49_37]OGN85019.1 MAG: hypothetical protein A2X27_09905 [Chloroflexi bacterium GWD2_49_16]HBG74947.1 hypothetical protein [Anaerolineae bacterium]HCC78329.1 hypothetical protein [Anaerolineae bacterium]